MRNLFLLLFIFCAAPVVSQVELNEQYLEHEVMLETPTGDLYGSLTTPTDSKLGIVALIIPGSGPTDRDGNSLIISGSNNSLKMLADSLAVKGISTLRIDKRGIAKSSKAAISEYNMRFEDMVEDAVRWLRFLKDDSRFKKVAVIGHSEGSLVGMLAAEISGVDAYVSIAGVGRPADELLREQLSKQLTPELMDTAKLYLEQLKRGEEVKNVNPMFSALFRPSVQPYLISWFKYNPAAEIAALKSKALLVQGTSDMQVEYGELAKLTEACPAAKLLVVEGMNHVLKQVGDDKNDNMKSYGDPSYPIATKLVEEVAKFLIAM